MLIKEVDLQEYLFNKDVHELPPKQRLAIIDSLRKMIEIVSRHEYLLKAEVLKLSQTKRPDIRSPG